MIVRALQFQLLRSWQYNFQVEDYKLQRVVTAFLLQKNVVRTKKTPKILKFVCVLCVRDNVKDWSLLSLSIEILPTFSISAKWQQSFEFLFRYRKCWKFFSPETSMKSFYFKSAWTRIFLCCKSAVRILTKNISLENSFLDPDYIIYWLGCD
jgi:hypothetical protein